MADRDIDGDTVAFVLILSLLGFMVAFLYMLLALTQPEEWRSFLAPVVRLTHSAFAAVGLFAALMSYRAKRPHWWIWLVMALIPIVQWVAIALWFSKGRKGPIQMGRFTL